MVESVIALDSRHHDDMGWHGELFLTRLDPSGSANANSGSTVVADASTDKNTNPRHTNAFSVTSVSVSRRCGNTRGGQVCSSVYFALVHTTRSSLGASMAPLAVPAPHAPGIM